MLAMVSRRVQCTTCTAIETRGPGRLHIAGRICRVHIARNTHSSRKRCIGTSRRYQNLFRNVLKVVAAYAFPFLRVLRSEEAFRVAFDRAFLAFANSASSEGSGSGC